MVGDIITVRGFGFAGIDGRVVETGEAARAAIREYLADPQVGVILVAQSIADLLGGEFDGYRLRRSLPLVLNIPDSTGAGMEGEDVQKLVQQALGIKL
ncbi:MAG: V-type ATP synthase subunit F [bacterium]|nr:V-type ATP synthase subunit F [bacterium]